MEVGMSCGWIVAVLMTFSSIALARSPVAEQELTGTIYDIDAGAPVGRTSLKLQLFPTENGERKRGELVCVPDSGAKALFTFSITTDPQGVFLFKAPSGPYLVTVTIPNRQPVSGCITVDAQVEKHSCGASSFRQKIYVRMGSSIAGFVGDIISSSACAASPASMCDPLGVPNLVTTSKFELLDSQGTPIRHSRLEFRQHSKKRMLVGFEVMTNSSGVADIATMPDLGRFLEMSVYGLEPGTYLIDFVSNPAPGQQTVQLFQWNCFGEMVQGAIVHP
jgi:hypothetical protein